MARRRTPLDQAQTKANPPSCAIEPVRHPALAELVKLLARAAAREHMAETVPLPSPAGSPAHDQDSQTERP
jgi:hypothetical protein